MPIYNPGPVIIEASIAELQNIGIWLQDRDDDPALPKTVLIGGWAVDAYNPYLGSVDIDIVTNSKTKNGLMYYLQTHKGYKYHNQFPFGKTVYREFSPHGSIILDFETWDSPYPFEGYPDRPFTLDILKGNTIMKPIRGSVVMTVPNRATLLFLKLKAAWDRKYRIDHRTSFDEQWEMGKMVKDCADILALIDPEAGGQEINLQILGNLVSQFSFLKELILRIPEIDPARIRYDERMSVHTIRTVCLNLESVL
jgi:hypothetical protein